MSGPQSQNNERGTKKERTENAMRQKAIMMLLNQNARQRLTNIRIVKPELALAVENYLINSASTGRLNRAISDEELKQLLTSLNQPKKEFRINRR